MYCHFFVVINLVHKRRFEIKPKKLLKLIQQDLFSLPLHLHIILYWDFPWRDFLVLYPTLQVFYLLSAPPTLFLTVKINSKAMRAAVYILLILITSINIAYAIYCRRLFPILAIISLVFMESKKILLNWQIFSVTPI